MVSLQQMVDLQSSLLKDLAGASVRGLQERLDDPLGLTNKRTTTG